uniref:Uncharacterized protein n=1 Tax=Aegilops tauschii subsp. strangulata TaxID=200361 RepID=A0A453A3U5_AEGTS
MEESRRLGGSQLQRTQAAVMPSRFMHSRQFSSEVSNSVQSEKQLACASCISQKQEENYLLIMVVLV